MIAIGLGLLALLVLLVSCSIAENANRVSKYKYDSKEY